MTDAPTPRVGIVGLGNIGRFHADHLRALDATLVGGVDIAESARVEFETECGVEAFATDEALYEHGVDAIVVTTPNNHHEEYTVAALERDVPVLVEKPLAHTAESAERIATAADASAAFCMVGFHRRFVPAIEVVKQRLAAGELGDVHHVEANFVRRRGIPSRGAWFTSGAAAGGGALIDIGVHVLDLALYFLEFPPIRTVDATILSEFGSRENYTYLEMWGEDRGPDRFDVEDSVRAFLRTEAGTSISLNVAWAANQPTDTEITITGSEGGARLDHESGHLELYTVAAGNEPQLLTSQVQTRQTDPYVAEHQTFLEAVRDGIAPGRNTVEQGTYVQTVVDSIYTAGETGDRIRLGEAASGGVPAD